MEYDSGRFSQSSERPQSGRVSNVRGSSNEIEEAPRRGGKHISNYFVLLIIFAIFVSSGFTAINYTEGQKKIYSADASATLSLVGENAYEDESCSGTGFGRSCRTSTKYSCTFTYNFTAENGQVVETTKKYDVSTTESCVKRFPSDSFNSTVYYSPDNPRDFVDENPKTSPLSYIAIGFTVVGILGFVFNFIRLVIAIFKKVRAKAALQIKLI